MTIIFQTLSQALSLLVLGIILIFALAASAILGGLWRLVKTFYYTIQTLTTSIPNSNDWTSWPFPDREKMTLPPPWTETEYVLPTTEDDTKLKCKKCGQHFKVGKKDDIKCDKSDCNVKYDINDDILDFRGFEESMMNEIETTSDFKSEAPKATKPIEWTEATWLKHLEDEGMTNQHSLI